LYSWLTEPKTEGSELMTLFYFSWLLNFTYYFNDFMYKSGKPDALFIN